MTAKKQLTGRESLKIYKSEKKIPLSPQIHTAEVPGNLRRHMDKSARLANI
jgi:hypothetical protein